MNLLRDIERQIDEKLRKLLGSRAASEQGRELVEVQRFILDRIEDRVVPLPRARRAFPFNEISVRIPVPDPERCAAFETVFVADDALQATVIEHLRREQVEFPRDLHATVSLVEAGGLAEPSVVCHERAAVKTGSVTVGFDLPSGEHVEITRNRIQLGRIAEVLDDRRRLVRRNDVVVEGDTVSRGHAHIETDSGEHRLFDDGSSYGTSVVHEGRLVEVPRGGGRGILIHSGDEIYLGQVRIGFRAD